MIKVLEIGVGGKKYPVRPRAPYIFRAKYYFCDKYPVEGIDYCDVEKYLPYPNNYFDLVVMSHVIEHLNNPEKALRNIYRVLKQGGKIIIYCPNWLSKDAKADPDHKHVFNIFSLRKLLKQTGYRIDLCYTVGSLIPKFFS